MRRGKSKLNKLWKGKVLRLGFIFVTTSFTSFWPLIHNFTHSIKAIDIKRVLKFFFVFTGPYKSRFSGINFADWQRDCVYMSNRQDVVQHARADLGMGSPQVTWVPLSEQVFEQHLELVSIASARFQYNQNKILINGFQYNQNKIIINSMAYWTLKL